MPPSEAGARNAERADAWLRRAVGVACIVGVWTGPPSVAEAQPKAKPTKPASDPAEAEAKLHMDNGVRLYQSGNFSGALVEFDAAYKAKPRSGPLINEALCFRDQHKYPEAVAALEKALRDHGDTMDAKNKQAAQTTIDEMKGLFAYLEVKPEPAQATVTIDGEAQASDATGPIAVGPDTHTLLVEASGYRPHVEKVVLAAGDKKSIPVKLERITGSLHVFAPSKDTSIEVDGQLVGKGEWSGPEPVGAHRIHFAGESNVDTIDVADGATATFDARKAKATLPPVPLGPKPKDPPPQPPHGFYGLVSGALLFTPTAPCAFLSNPATCKTGSFSDLSRNAGGAGSLRGGYRVHTFAAFEGEIEYSNITGGNGAGSAGYSLTDIRLGPLLRLMSPGKLVHFVGTLGGGLAFDFVKFENTDQIKPHAGSGPCLRDSARQCFDSWGVDFYVTTEVGMEFNIQNVLIGASLAVIGNALKGADDNPGSGPIVAATAGNTNQFNDKAAIFVGPRVHFGYAFW